jgi:lysophospholipase L1-like esterase
MDVRGQRILIFGDSLSHHGPDAGPEIWDVDTGSNRASGQPGDLLASMLLEQGASAVRVNARVGRSAHNFFGRENFQALLGSDQAFMPTKVFVVLGTNDIGLNLDVDKQAMTKIRDFYKGLGADVWAIGPFAYANDQLTQQALPVIEMMQSVFGKNRYIDPRPITAMVGRARDGVHFGGDAARVTAQGLQKLVLDAAQPKTWLPFAIGILGAVGGALAYSWWKKGKIDLPMISGLGRQDTPPVPPPTRSTPVDAWHPHESHNEWQERLREVQKLREKGYKLKGLDDLGETCSVNMPPAAFKRCVARQKRGLGEDPLAERQRVSKQIKELIADPDPGALVPAEDLALQHEIKLSELSKGGTDNRGTFWLDNNEDIFKRDRVSWRVKRVNERHGGECKAVFDVRIDGARVGGEERESDHVKFEEHYQGNMDYCRRAATAQAWALAKETKKLRAQGFTPQARDIFHTLDRDNSEPEELFGLRGEREDRNEFPTETFKMLTQTAQTPAELVAATDYALEHGIKIGELRTLYLSPVGAPDDPATRVSWTITRLPGRSVDGKQLYDVEWNTLLDNKPLHIGAGYPRRAKSLRELEQIVGAEAWEVANELKLYRGKNLTEGAYRQRVVDAIYRDSARDHLKEQPELFGLGARKIKTSRYATREEAMAAGRMNENVTYFELDDEDLRNQRNMFRRLINNEGPEALDIAEDFAEQNEIPISVLTTMNHDHADSGAVRIYPQDGSNNVYNVWWDVHEDPKNPGQWEPELLLAWGLERDEIASVPHIRNGEWTKPLIPFGTADTEEEARRVAAMGAWQVSKLLRTLPRSASLDDARKLLRDFEQSPSTDRRFAAAHHTLSKHHLFGLRGRAARKNAGMGSTTGYRVAYNLVTRRDGKIVSVRKIVDAPRALTLPEAEAWRRKWKQQGTAWVETMDGQHVPVKGAMRPVPFYDDARPGDVHATLTADYARPR